MRTAPSTFRFGDGLVLGFAAIPSLAWVVLLFHADMFAAMYRSLAPGYRLPGATALVLHPATRVVAPLVLLAIVLGIYARRGVRPAVITFAVGATLAAIASYVAAYAPLYQLSAAVTHGS